MSGSFEKTLAAVIGAEAAAGLMPHLEVVEVPAGRSLVLEGELSDTLWFVASGAARAELVKGSRRLVLGDIQPGHWVGEVNLIDRGPASATVTTTEPSVLLRLCHADLVRLRDEEPAVANALLETLIRDLSARVRRTSAGLVQRVNAAEFRVSKPDERRGWFAQALESLFGRGGR